MLYINSAYTQIKTSTHHPIHPQTLCVVPKEAPNSNSLIVIFIISTLKETEHAVCAMLSHFRTGKKIRTEGGAIRGPH